MRILSRSAHSHGAGHFSEHARLAEEAGCTTATARWKLHRERCSALVALRYATYVDAQSYDQRANFSRPHFTHSTAYVEYIK